MYTISKTFRFEASHMLVGLPDDHQCSRLHGHSYRIEVELQGDTLTEEGWVRDYGDLDRIKGYIADALDHRHLNSIVPQPTAEHLARYLHDMWIHWYPDMTAVSVYETASTKATYSPCRGTL